MHGDRERCLAVGMDDYIAKPVRLGDVQAALERWGPTKAPKFDTSFLRRTQTATASAKSQPAQALPRLPGSLTDDGASLLRDVIEMFLESAPARIAQIEQHLGDPAQLAFHAHTLKSMSLILGCERVVALARRLEELGRAGAVQAAPPLVRELEAAFAEARSQLLALRDQEIAGGAAQP
jgi:HPt (histidine-containing phosphotransfer) domain-containing protein